jgi:two-component sensor histidine kinase
LLPGYTCERPPIFGSSSILDSAIIYAQKAVQIAPRFNQLEYLSTSYLLLGHLHRDYDTQKALYYYKQGIVGYRRLGNHSHRSFLLNGMAKIYFREKQYRRALSYSDSSILEMQLPIRKKEESPTVLSGFYELRASIFAAIGRLDSAYHYERLNRQLALQWSEELRQKQIVEVEAKYNDEKKALQLEEQELQLSYERARRNELIIMMVAILIFLAILTYLYFRLQAANLKTRKQSDTIRQTNAELAQSLEQQIMLQGEIHHRVKNNLQVIISLLDLQQDEIQDPKALDSLNAMSSRIYSIAAIHDILYRKQGSATVRLNEYVETLCQHFRQMLNPQKSPQFTIDILDSTFNLETLMPIGIMLNELMTNSIKHAVLPYQMLEITIRLEPCADGFCLDYRDNGPGYHHTQLEERQGGLGSYLLKSMVRQLNGQLKSFNEQGAVTQIFFKEKNRHRDNYEYLPNINR